MRDERVAFSGAEDLVHLPQQGLLRGGNLGGGHGNSSAQAKG
ncbi:hypothetical protein ACQEVY_28075 [Streptomyces sp. CA-288835]